MSAFRCTIYNTGVDCDTISVGDSWLYGLLSAVIISLASLAGVCILLIKNAVMKRTIMEVFVSFAAGALLGDATMHIIPAALGVGDEGRLQVRCACFYILSSTLYSYAHVQIVLIVCCIQYVCIVVLLTL